MEEAVVVGRQWERIETLGLRKAEDIPVKKSPARGEQRGRGEGQSRVRETVEVGVKNPTRN